MGLFNKLITKFTGGDAPKSQSLSLPTRTSVTSTIQASSPASHLSISITYSGTSGPPAEVSDAEVAQAAGRYAFVLTNELPLVKTADQWWAEETHKRRVRDGSEKAYAWLAPFIPVELAKRERLKGVTNDCGPLQAVAIAKELRTLIRERRKTKQPYEDILQALYGACVMVDFVASLEFEGRQPHSMTQYVDIHEIQAVRIDYSTMGYQSINALGSTDVKWLVEAFGEPSEHQPFDGAWPHVRRNAISRHCWSELHSANKTSKSLGIPQRTMQEWLNELVKRNIGYHKEWQDRVTARTVQDTELEAKMEAAWIATTQVFIVADLETTGLNSATDEVIEFAAIKVSSTGKVLAEFSMLVCSVAPIPEVITKLTGITPSDIAREGRPLGEAMKAFVDFVGTQPVFFHNAPFDVGFLKKSATQTRQKFGNPVHDTLPMARVAWPSLESYKLATLAQHVGTQVPTHRALADAKATLAVLLVARALVRPSLGNS